MPEHFGPHMGGSWPIASLMMWGLSTLFWIGVPVLLFWLLWRAWGGTSDTSAFLSPTPTRPPLVNELSAVELLRRRYVLGEIDAGTFEEMLARLLSSEERERACERASFHDEITNF